MFCISCTAVCLHVQLAVVVQLLPSIRSVFCVGGSFDTLSASCAAPCLSWHQSYYTVLQHSWHDISTMTQCCSALGMASVRLHSSIQAAKEQLRFPWACQNPAAAVSLSSLPLGAGVCMPIVWHAVSKALAASFRCTCKLKGMEHVCWAFWAWFLSPPFGVCFIMCAWTHPGSAGSSAPVCFAPSFPHAAGVMTLCLAQF